VRSEAVRMPIVIVLPHYYISWEVVRMLWLANSPDLNLLVLIKLETTKKGAIYLDEELRAA
jgi:hypothetical protein